MTSQKQKCSARFTNEDPVITEMRNLVMMWLRDEITAEDMTTQVDALFERQTTLFRKEVYRKVKGSNQHSNTN